MSYQKLVRLLDLVAPLDAELYLWLKDGKHGLDDGEHLERALAIVGPHAKRIRNLALRRAVEIIDPLGELNAWHRAEALLAAIRRFERTVWPVVRDSANPTLAPLDGALFDAFSARAGMLRSQRKLYDIIR